MLNNNKPDLYFPFCAIRKHVAPKWCESLLSKVMLTQSALSIKTRKMSSIVINYCTDVLLRAFIPISLTARYLAQSLQYLFCVSRDTPHPGAHFEQVTFQRLGPCLYGARTEHY